MTDMNTLDIEHALSADTLASEISETHDRWKRAMRPFLDEYAELRDYVYATDTSTTTDGALGFKNSTHIPVLSMITDNMHANIMMSLFPNDEWLSWESHDSEAAGETKRRTIEAYARTKAREQNFKRRMSPIIMDLILFGNCFARTVYVKEAKEIEDETGQKQKIPGYVGPRVERISPHDIVFNIAASSFEESPKIIRSLISPGQLKKNLNIHLDEEGSSAIVQKVMKDRKTLINGQKGINKVADLDKQRAMTADGFGNLTEYYNSNLIEVLEFYGDLYDVESDTLYENHVITIVDRKIVARKEPIKSWTGSSYIRMGKMKDRPDNLMGMSVLSNLVGMQYKVNKLENLRADVFDQIAHPQTVIIGDVEYTGEEKGEPGAEYYIQSADGGSVHQLRPDATALNADLQINQTIQLMELVAGSPREAMGIRTPGEKTLGEVSRLENAASRIITHRKASVEEDLVEKILLDFIEIARRNLDAGDMVRSLDSTFGIEEFITVTKEDLSASGKLVAKGSRHFAENANMLQALTQLSASPILGLIAPHISRKKMADIVEQLMGLEKFDLMQDNVGISEDMETAQLQNTAQDQAEMAATTPGFDDLEEEL